MSKNMISVDICIMREYRYMYIKGKSKRKEKSMKPCAPTKKSRIRCLKGCAWYSVFFAGRGSGRGMAYMGRSSGRSSGRSMGRGMVGAWCFTRSFMS